MFKTKWKCVKKEENKDYFLVTLSPRNLGNGDGWINYTKQEMTMAIDKNKCNFNVGEEYDVDFKETQNRIERLKENSHLDGDYDGDKDFESLKIETPKNEDFSSNPMEIDKLSDVGKKLREIGFDNVTLMIEGFNVVGKIKDSGALILYNFMENNKGEGIQVFHIMSKQGLEKLLES